MLQHTCNRIESINQCILQRLAFGCSSAASCHTKNYKMHWKIAKRSTHAQAIWGQTCCAADGIGGLQLASCASFDLQRLRMANTSAIELAQHSDQAGLSAADFGCVQALPLGFHRNALEPCKHSPHVTDRHTHIYQGSHNGGFLAKMRREGLASVHAMQKSCMSNRLQQTVAMLYMTVMLVQDSMLMVWGLRHCCHQHISNVLWYWQPEAVSSCVMAGLPCCNGVKDQSRKPTFYYAV